MARVPYSGTVLPNVIAMAPGHCEVRAPKWWGVHNHLGTFHAIAACNLAEIAMGMLAEATVPAGHRWIPRSMTVDYLAKATPGLRATAHLDTLPDFGPVGRALAAALVDRGHSTTVWNRTPGWADDLAVTHAGSAAAAIVNLTTGTPEGAEKLAARP